MVVACIIKGPLESKPKVEIREFSTVLSGLLACFCMTRNEMEGIGLGSHHCGDIIVQLMPTFCETHGNCPTTVAHEGYSLENLLMMIGADFKQGEIFRRVARVTDVVPTICHLTGIPVPGNVEGGVLWQALKGFVEDRYLEFTKRLLIGKTFLILN